MSIFTFNIDRSNCLKLTHKQTNKKSESSVSYATTQFQENKPGVWPFYPPFSGQQQHREVCFQSFYHSSLTSVQIPLLVMLKSYLCSSCTNSTRNYNWLTALVASSGVENATKPEPLLMPLGSRITYYVLGKGIYLCHQQNIVQLRLAEKGILDLARRNSAIRCKELFEFLVRNAVI